MPLDSIKCLEEHMIGILLMTEAIYKKLGGFYGFDVMDRYPCFSDYNYEIKDYPNW